jgi:hypothetical protein
MKKFIVVLVSFFLGLGLTSCVEEKIIEPNFCHCGEVIQRGVQRIWIKNECSGNVIQQPLLNDELRHVQNRYCYSDYRSW